MENLIYLVFLKVASLLTNCYCKKVTAAISPMQYEQEGGNQLFQQCSHFPLVLVSLLWVHAGWEPFVAGLREAVEMKLMHFSIAPLSCTIQSMCAASVHNISPFLTWVFQFLCSNWELLPDAYSENYGCTCVYLDSIYFGNATTCVDRALRFVVFIFPFLFCVFLKISINSLLDHLEKMKNLMKNSFTEIKNVIFSIK